MLWTALYFPQLPLEVFVPDPPQDPERARAISHTRNSREIVMRCNPAATIQGICPGLPVPAALALCSGLQVLARDETRERAALQGLALWAYQFSPHISLDPLMLLIETGASLRLFGNPESLSGLLSRDLDQLGHEYRIAMAPTPAAANLLARTHPGSITRTTTELRRQIDGVALARLTRDTEVRALIDAIGLGTIGECLTLPRGELARRTSPKLILLFDRLLGQAPDPRPAWQPPEHFEQHLEFPGEIIHHTALCFPARRLILALCGYLRGHGGSVQHLHWRLEHREIPATDFQQGLMKPSRDAHHILDIFRERIERVSLPGPVVAMSLQVTDWLAFEEQTADLLQERASPKDEAFLERLRNRLGEERVQGLSVIADYRPERAWSWCPPGTGRNEETGEHQPLWLLDPPCPLSVHEQAPSYGGTLALERLPERIETGWWDGFDIVRDYFVAHNPDGERLWVFRDRRSGEWYLHGLFH
ncbi:MAG: DNA polymerase Y family protein [Gammaproteobacteria bacterium]|nr:DNA polymerase Y family protein [Gammaproteobacteria bacterium]